MMAEDRGDVCTVELPYSKSIRARYLMMGAVYGRKLRFNADCDDISTLSGALATVMRSSVMLNRMDVEQVREVDVCHSGTALRFVTAFAAALPGANVRIAGSERLCMRPIGGLVDALRELGADIEYCGRDGCAPLVVRGRRLRGGDVTVRADVSSQYVSALMLVTPLMEAGLNIRLCGGAVSEGYVGLTAGMMGMYGVSPTVTQREIRVPKGMYRFAMPRHNVTEERDWSAATFWMAAVAVSGGVVRMPGLLRSSMQPDAAVAGVFERMGVRCDRSCKESVVRGGGECVGVLEVDCGAMPDAIPAIAVTACVLGLPFVITGASTLESKECRRASALVEELGKCGYAVSFDGVSVLRHTPSEGEGSVDDGVLRLDAHGDHRMAMALSIVGLRRVVEIVGRESVSKSYPGYWSDYEGYKGRRNSVILKEKGI